MDVLRRRDALPWALLLVVVVQSALFLVAARRGLDLTDEGFYLLTFQHWTEWPSVSLFGAYFSLPFSLLGHSVWAMRAIGVVLLLVAGTWFSHEVNRGFDALHRRDTREGLSAASLAGGTAIWSYYGAFVVPYTPSYNLLTLACALLTLASALRLGRRSRPTGANGSYGLAFALGFAASVGIASKFSSGVLVLGIAVLVVATFAWRRLTLGTWLRIATAVAVGLLLNLALLWLADPDLPRRFQRGIEVTLAMYPRNTANELGTLATVELPRELAACLRILLWPLVAALLAFALGLKTIRPLLANAVAVFAFVAGAALVTFVKDNRPHRIVLMTLVACLLAVAAMWMRRDSKSAGARWQSGLVGAALLCVPFAYSIGTSNALVRHMGMAAVFPSVLAIAQIRTMRLERSIPGWAFAAALAFLAVLPVEIVVRQWTNGDATYRLGAPLAQQIVPLPSNPARIELRVSPLLARDAGDFLRLASASGFAAGQPMIDFTGQSPGLVALCGGTPLGAIWIVGGPAFDGDAMARLSLRDVAAKDLRRAWLLTSPDSFAAIRSWRTLMDERGAFAHEEAGRVTIADPTSEDKTKTIDVTLWRPRP